MLNKLIKILFALTLILISACSSSGKNPGFTIYSTPDDFNVDTHRVCSSRFLEWKARANTPINPALGTSKIKQILSSVHNLALSYWTGCPDIAVEKDLDTGFVLFQLANDFEYIPTRFVLGKELISGEIVNQDVDLGIRYLQQVVDCDSSFNRTYGRQAEDYLRRADRGYTPWSRESRKRCKQINGAYFKGPTVEFDALAFKVDWEGRSAAITEDWGWLGAGFRGTTEIVREAIPIALAGASAYYIAKASGEFAAVRSKSAPASSSPSTFETTITAQSVYNQPVGNFNDGLQLFASDRGCNSDFDCGYGKVCVKPKAGLSLTGRCGSLVDDFGMPLLTVPAPASTPRELSNCGFDTDCPIGFQCSKQSYELVGICVR